MIIMHVQLTGEPKYNGVIGVVFDGINDSNGIIYRIEDVIKQKLIN